jgi:exonuclease SbcC
MQVLSLTLKGFRGIRNGLNRERLSLDFERLADGAPLVAIAGAKGRGKSTVMDNMHPYPALAPICKGSADCWAMPTKPKPWCPAPGAGLPNWRKRGCWRSANSTNCKGRVKHWPVRRGHCEGPNAVSFWHANAWHI